MIDYVPPDVPQAVVEFANKHSCTYISKDLTRTPYKRQNVYNTSCNIKKGTILFILENDDKIQFAENEDFYNLFMFDGNPIVPCK